jgi:preprotein translocase subunit SecG
MNDAILVGLFFAIIICMGYLFERARMKKEDKGDK